MLDTQASFKVHDPMEGPGGVRRLQARWLIQGTLRLATAAHFGSGDEGTEVDMPLLRDKVSGNPLLTGASLAGALRSHLADRQHGYAVQEANDDSVVALFGGTRGDKYGDQSPLILFDSIGQLPQGGVAIRDGVAIEAAKGVAAEHLKYDLEVSPPGTRFALRLEFLVKIDAIDATEAGLLSALVTALEGFTAGEIYLGSRKTRGLGRCAVSSWQAKRYDLSSHAGWLEWLLSDHVEPLGPQAQTYASAKEAVQQAAGHPLSLLDRDERKRVVIILDLTTTGGLLVRSPSAESDAPDVGHLQSGGESVLPGTSLAGVLRARALRIATLVRSPQGDAQQWVEGIFGPPPKSGKDSRDSPLKASRLIVQEVPMKGGHRLQPTRIRIDRFTGGVVDGALFEEEPHYRGEAQTKIELRSPQDAELGLLLLTLKDLITEDLPVGGSSSVGRGFFKGSVTLQADGAECSFGSGKTPDAPSRKKLEDYVQAFHNAEPLRETSQ